MSILGDVVLGTIDNFIYQSQPVFTDYSFDTQQNNKFT